MLDTVGMDDGTTEGSLEGAKDEDGWKEGTREGAFDKLGSLEGSVDGILDKLGLDDGILDGEKLGSNDGSYDGFALFVDFFAFKFRGMMSLGSRRSGCLWQPKSGPKTLFTIVAES